ncbi:uncharacterized protein LOC134196129 [Corticium candelabrum]|uniref:uncharacterized protein LOC134196129 n=1 Tax=Corticium candelabrum TaxID=121492 RepID=UPI002E26FAD3|nr:uncharacterized protein LOC134196129 [Corticium candelabrum]
MQATLTFLLAFFAVFLLSPELVSSKRAPAAAKKPMCNRECKREQLIRNHRQQLEDKLRQDRLARRASWQRNESKIRWTEVNQDDLLALVSLYNNTNGAKWVKNSGWTNGMHGDPCGQQWYGVSCNADNRVIDIEMVYNRLSGRLPDDLARADQLQHLVLYSNALSGPIPSNLFSHPNLVELNLNYNELSGQLPSQVRMPKLERLILYTNKLTGPLPEEWDTPELFYFEISSNVFTGRLPPAIGDLEKLELLIISRNNLTGPFPSSLARLSRLNKLWLFNNELRGEFPDLRSSSNMNDCQMDGITGPFPNWLASSWPKVQYLLLVRGNMSGQLPESVCDIQSIKQLWLFQNNFEGEIPSCLGRLKSLLSLELSDNKLSGSIPESLGDASSLRDLYLSRNNLTGGIPESLGNLKMEILDLSNNMLIGGIPSSFENYINHTFSFSLCYNLLSGPIPQNLETFFKFIDHFTCNLYDNPWSCPLPSFVPKSCQCGCSECSSVADHTECSQCTAHSHCGYCSYGSNCLAGIQSGSTGYFCPVGQWKYAGEC